MLKGLAGNKVLVTTLFGRNFLVCLQNHASRKDRHLHAIAIETLASIESVAAAEPKSIVPIMEGLLGPNGNYDFEPRTHTKVVEKILKHTRAEDVKAVMTLLETPFKKTSGYVPQSKPRPNSRTLTSTSGKERLSAFGNAYIIYLYYLASSGAAPALEKLCLLAFSGPDVRSKYGLSESSKATCKTHLESAFAKSIRSTGDYDGICRAVTSMKPDSVVELDEEVAAQQKVALKSLKSLLKNKEASAEDKKTLQAVALLHAVALFQIYSLAPGAESLLAGVNTFYESFKGGAEEEAWQLLIVRVLLPMVHRPSALGRLVSKHVFECFAPKLDLEAMQVLVERLEFTEDLAGYNDLLGDINAEGDSDEEEDVSGSEAGSGEEQDDKSDEDSDGSMDLDQGQLMKALGSHLIDGEEQKPTENGKKPEKKADKKAEKNGKKDDDEEGTDSESDADMTDSEMMAINDQLVTAFDHITNTGPESKEAKEAKTFVTNFKGRIVDLVEAYLQQQPGNAAVIFPILPDLIRFVGRTASSDLRVRVVELLARYRKRFVKDRKRWLEEGSGKGVKENLAVLEQIHEEMGGRDSAKFAKGASSACLVVAAAVVAIDRAKIGELNRMHERLEGEMKGRKRKVHKSFFETWKAYQQSVCNGAEQA